MVDFLAAQQCHKSYICAVQKLKPLHPFNMIKKLLCVLLFMWSIFFTGYVYADSQIDSLITLFENQIVFSYHDAAQTLNKIEKLGQTQNDLSVKSQIASSKALYLLKVEDNNQEALLYAHKALHFSKQVNDSLAILKNLRILFSSHLLALQKDSSFYYASKALEFSQALQLKEHMAKALLDMSEVYYLNKRHEEVKEYRWRAYQIAYENNLTRLLADIYLKISQSHLRLSRQRTQEVLDSAMYYAEKSLDYAKKDDYSMGIFTASVVLADYLNVSKEHKKARKLIESVIDFPKESIPVRYVHTAPFYYAVILKDNQEYKKAKEIMQDLILKLPQDDHANRMSSSFFLSVLYSYLGKPDSADLVLKQGVIANNAANEERMYEKIAKLQTQYETEKKEQKIKELEQVQEIEKLEIQALQRQRLVLGLSLLAPLSFIFAGGWYVNRRRLRLQLEAEQKERAKQLSELKALRSQMNPHFIFNALNSIQDFIMLSEKENAQHYLGKFAILMRGFLESSSKERVSLDKELSLLKSYIELEGLRLGEEFSYEIIFDKNIDADELEDIEVPPLMIQPYLENAFKHGLLHKAGEKKLTLAFDKIEKQNNHFLQLKITDNGVGRQKSAEINQRKRKTHQSFATQATQERLELLKSQSITNQNIEVTINDLIDNYGNATGTEVIILIPN